MNRRLRITCLLLCTCNRAPQFQSMDGGEGIASDMIEFVAAHNAARARAAPAANPVLPVMAWDDNAAQIASNYAQQCTFLHNPNRGALGENLFAAAGTDLTPTQVVGNWEGESQFYDYAANSCQASKQCGHYTQVVWRNSIKVGCATQDCEQGSPIAGFSRWRIWVCDYSPPGNVVGQKPY